MLRSLLAVLLFSLPALCASTVTVFFTALPETNLSGTYNGFSTATVNGTPSQLLICDDYDDTTYMPSSANLIYDFSMLSGSDPLQYAMFSTSKYDEAAVLVYELATAVNPSATTITDYQYALWNLMTPSANLVSGRVAQEQALQTTALAMVNDAADAQFLATTVYAYTEIYTPSDAYAGNQEFMEYNAPEPGFGWASGVVLALAACLQRLKLRRMLDRSKPS